MIVWLPRCYTHRVLGGCAHLLIKAQGNTQGNILCERLSLFPHQSFHNAARPTGRCATLALPIRLLDPPSERRCVEPMAAGWPLFPKYTTQHSFKSWDSTLILPRVTLAHCVKYRGYSTFHPVPPHRPLPGVYVGMGDGESHLAPSLVVAGWTLLGR